MILLQRLCWYSSISYRLRSVTLKFWVKRWMSTIVNANFVLFLNLLLFIHIMRALMVACAPYMCSCPHRQKMILHSLSIYRLCLTIMWVLGMEPKSFVKANLTLTAEPFNQLQFYIWLKCISYKIISNRTLNKFPFMHYTWLKTKKFYIMRKFHDFNIILKFILKTYLEK